MSHYQLCQNNIILTFTVAIKDRQLTKDDMQRKGGVAWARRKWRKVKNRNQWPFRAPGALLKSYHQYDRLVWGILILTFCHFLWPLICAVGTIIFMRAHARFRNDLFWHIRESSICFKIADNVTDIVMATITGHDWEPSSIMRLLLKKTVCK